MKYHQVAKRQAMHVIVFGDPKSGKSVLTSQLAEKGMKLLWISLDNGHIILDELSDTAKENLEIIVLPDTKEFPVAITTCLRLISGAEVKICNSHGQVNCSTCNSRKLEGDEYWTTVCLGKLGLDTVVVFDHISQLADSAMNWVIQAACTKDGKLDAGKADLYKAGYDEYRLQGALMNKFLTNVQQAPYHTVCIAHVFETELEDGSKKLVPQVGTSNFSSTSGKYFDHMVYCKVMNKAHKFGSSTTYLAGVITGSRTKVAIENLTEPTLLPFFDGTREKQEQAGNASAQKALTSISSGGGVTAATAAGKPISTLDRLAALRGNK